MCLCFSRQMQFCYYCVELITRTCVPRHCRDVHKQPTRTLKVGEEPPEPRFLNWSEWVEDPASVFPQVIPSACYMPASSLTSMFDKTPPVGPVNEIGLSDMIDDLCSKPIHSNVMVQTPPKNPSKRLKNPPIKDTCGNFNVFFKKGFIDKKQVKEIKNYSKLHCV